MDKFSSFPQCLVRRLRRRDRQRCDFGTVLRRLVGTDFAIRYPVPEFHLDPRTN